MPLDNYGAIANSMAQAVSGDLWQGTQTRRNDQYRNALLQQRQEVIDRQDAEDQQWHQAVQTGDWPTAYKIDPQATQLYQQHVKEQAMSGLGDISVTAKPMDENAIQKQANWAAEMTQKRQAESNDQAYRNASLGTQAAQERRLANTPQKSVTAPNLPPLALKLVDDANQALAATGESDALVSKAINTLESGKVTLGPVANAESRARNYTGLSDENSRAYADIRQTLEKLRNNYLLLAKGVQTEGDAQRAWNSEIGENVQNDNKLALQQLKKAKSMLNRAATAQRNRINTVYGNYGTAPPTDGPVIAPAQPATPSAHPADIQALLTKYGQ